MSMTLEQYDTNLQNLLARAGELLGSAARPVELGWDVERLFRRQTKRISRHGLQMAPPLLSFSDGRRGHALSVGMELLRVETPAGELRLVRVSPPCDCVMTDFYAVAERDVRRFYRVVRQLGREVGQQLPPLLAPEIRDALWHNTVGWFTRERDRMLEFHMPLRRGVLLLGSPGNGKTMACRWLRSECLRRGLEWSSVSRQQFEAALADGSTRELFELDRPGVILFDDFEAALRDRAKYGEQHQGTFLTELDGMYPKSGVVYIFTSNLEMEEIDPAARRPGRIDLVLGFAPPDATLRRRLIDERWPREIVANLSLDVVVEDTQGLSFAELEEARKLLVLRYLDHGVADWTQVRPYLLQQQREAVGRKRVAGFSAGTRVEAEEAMGAAAKLNE